jgi:multiple sugar transport system permease protein
MLTWLKNSAIYSVGGTALALVAAIPAGYGLALTQFIGRRTLLGITLVVMIMPATALVLPLFLEASAVHLIGTDWSVILPFAFFPFGVYLAYIYFSSTIPKDRSPASRTRATSPVADRRPALGGDPFGWY